MTHAIEVSQAVKSFGRKNALDQLSLKVPAGSVFALLGENGAGKTTLIRALMGYYKLNSGSISVLGFNPQRDYVAIRRRTGYVADQPAMYDWMTVQEVGWYTSGFYPEGFAAAYTRIANEFRLPADTRIRDLSKGMRAKVALSLALAMDPELLILDEPTSGLDPLVRRSFLESMIDRAAMGKTVLLSSHQIQEVERVADHVAIIRDGQVQISAPLETLKTEITQVTLTLRDILLPTPDMADLHVYQTLQNGRQVRMTLRGWSPEWTTRVSEDPNIVDVQIHRPSLEDLYIAFGTEPILPAKDEEPVSANVGQ